MTYPSPWDYPWQHPTDAGPHPVTQGTHQNRAPGGHTTASPHSQNLLEYQVPAPVATGSYRAAVPSQVTPHALRKQEDLMLNILLYLASLLIVSAAGLFLSRAASPVLKLTLLILCALAFYGAGLATYRLVTKLRLASYSFVGTALALIPLAGYAFYLDFGGSGRLVWLLTSAIGTLGVLGAATMMQGRFMSYLFVGFMVSNALALTRVVGLGFVWYFVVLMVLATILGLCIHFLPGKLPGTLQRGFVDTSVIFVPALVISLYFFIYRLSAFEMALILGLASVHAGVFTLLRPSALHYIQLRIFPLLALAELGTALAPSNGYPLGWWLAAAAAIAIALVLPSTPLSGVLPSSSAAQPHGGRFRWSASTDAHLTLASALLLVLGVSFSFRTWVIFNNSQVAETERWAHLSPLLLMNQGSILPHVWFFLPLYLLAVYRWHPALTARWMAFAYASAAVLFLSLAQTLSTLGVTLALATFLLLRGYRRATPHRAAPLSLPVAGYTLALVLIASDLITNQPSFIVSLGLLACGTLGLAAFALEQPRDHKLAAHFPISTPVGGQTRTLAPIRWAEPIIFIALSALGAIFYQPPRSSIPAAALTPTGLDYTGWVLLAVLLLGHLVAGLFSYRFLTPGSGPSIAHLILLLLTQALGLMSARITAPVPLLSYLYLLLLTAVLIVGAEKIRLPRAQVSLVVRLNLVLAVTWYLRDYSLASAESTAHALIVLFTLLAVSSVMLYHLLKLRFEGWLFLGFAAGVVALLVPYPAFFGSYLATALLCLILIALAIIADRLLVPLTTPVLSLSVFALCLALWNWYIEDSMQEGMLGFNLLSLIGTLTCSLYVAFLPAPGSQPEALTLGNVQGRLRHARSRWAILPLLSLHTLYLLPDVFSREHALILALVSALTALIWCLTLGATPVTAAIVAVATGTVRACLPLFEDSALFAFLQLIALVFIVLLIHRVVQLVMAKKGAFAPPNGLFVPALVFQSLSTLIASVEYVFRGRNMEENLVALLAVLALIILGVVARHMTVVVLSALLLLFHLTVVIAGFSFALLFVLGLALIGFVVLRLLKRPAEPALPYQAQAQAQATQPVVYQRQPWDFPGDTN